MVVPSCAVTTTVMAVSPPSVRAMAPLAWPVVTAVPFTLTVAFSWSTVGVTLMLLTALATPAVYAVYIGAIQSLSTAVGGQSSVPANKTPNNGAPSADEQSHRCRPVAPFL